MLLVPLFIWFGYVALLSQSGREGVINLPMVISACLGGGFRGGVRESSLGSAECSWKVSGCWGGCIPATVSARVEVLLHMFNMELDLQSLFGPHVYSCTHWLRPRTLPPTPRSWAHIRGRYWSDKIDDISCDPLPCIARLWGLSQCPLHLHDTLYVHIVWLEFSWWSGYNSTSLLHEKNVMLNFYKKYLVYLIYCDMLKL
jgi:hypothetical protein